ncbi:MAG: hypothetical protein AAGF15_11455, partial [Pseudomonadota bacterium]
MVKGPQSPERIPIFIWGEDGLDLWGRESSARAVTALETFVDGAIRGRATLAREGAALAMLSRQQLLPWLVVAYGFGMGVYFALPFEPPWALLIVIGAGVGMALAYIPGTSEDKPWAGVSTLGRVTLWLLLAASLG